jgi:hypothetical protein
VAMAPARRALSSIAVISVAPDGEHGATVHTRLLFPRAYARADVPFKAARFVALLLQLRAAIRGLTAAFELAALPHGPSSRAKPRGAGFTLESKRHHHEQYTAPATGVYAVTKNGDRSYWREIGAAWPHSDGEGFNLKLDYLPPKRRRHHRPRAQGRRGRRGSRRLTLRAVPQGAALSFRSGIEPETRTSELALRLPKASSQLLYFPFFPILTRFLHHMELQNGEQAGYVRRRGAVHGLRRPCPMDSRRNHTIPSVVEARRVGRRLWEMQAVHQGTRCWDKLD